jgi:hypothetical protein
MAQLLESVPSYGPQLGLTTWHLTLAPDLGPRTVNLDSDSLILDSGSESSGSVFTQLLASRTADIPSYH